MLNAYAVFDVKAASYGMPMFISTDGIAVRGFTEACNNPQSPLFQYPGDYSLYKIGEYDPVSGKLVSMHPDLLMHAAAAKKVTPVEVVK